MCALLVTCLFFNDMKRLRVQHHHERESFYTAAGSGSDLSRSFCPLIVRCYKLSGKAADKLHVATRNDSFDSLY